MIIVKSLTTKLNTAIQACVTTAESQRSGVLILLDEGFGGINA